MQKIAESDAMTFFWSSFESSQKIARKGHGKFLKQKWATVTKRLRTAVYDYMKALPSSIKEIIFYSDTCNGQHRSCNFSAMCLHAMQKVSLVNIEHKYFESGQSQMEVNSVHFTKDRATKYSDMNIPSEWYTAVC